MVIRNRLAALIYRTVVFALLVYAFSFYWEEFGSFWASISCFDVELGIAAAVILGFEILFNLIDMRHGVFGVAAGSYMPLTLPIIGFSALSAFFYFTYSLPTSSAPNGPMALLFHSVLLVGPLFDWLLFGEKGTVRLPAGFNAMVYPLLYYLFGYFRTVIWPNDPIYNGNMYAYPFLDFRDPNIVLYSILYFAVALGFVMLLLLVNNLLAGKYRRFK